jgi:anti-anti-sigma factor
MPNPPAGLGSHGFDCSTETVAGSVVIRLQGELDMATAPQFARLLNAALDIGASTLVLDLAGLSFLDSSGIHVLLSAHHRAGHECSFVVRSPTGAVLKVLRLTGLDQLMVIESGRSLN